MILLQWREPVRSFVTSDLFSVSAALTTTSFSGSWTTNSPVLTREVDHQVKQFYYEAIEVTVPMMGSYLFTGSSINRINGDLYDVDFDPVNPSLNLIIPADVKNNGEEPLKIVITLRADHIYVLVVTPCLSTTTGEFSIVSSGPAMVDLRSAQNMTTMLMETTSEYPLLITMSFFTHSKLEYCTVTKIRNRNRTDTLLFQPQPNRDFSVSTATEPRFFCFNRNRTELTRMRPRPNRTDDSYNRNRTDNRLS